MSATQFLIIGAFLFLLGGAYALGLALHEWLGEKCAACAASRGTSHLVCARHGRRGWRK